MMKNQTDFNFIATNQTMIKRKKEFLLGSMNYYIRDSKLLKYYRDAVQIWKKYEC